ncbi:LysR substrate-binding domain-containing protein, partial [Acinetobacter baumannii]
RQIRRSRGRSVVNVTTFASFASLWLIPRLCQFQKHFPDIDIRVSALDRIADLDDGEHDLALRYASAGELGLPAELMFEESVSPVV